MWLSGFVIFMLVVVMFEFYFIGVFVMYKMVFINLLVVDLLCMKMFY